MGDAESRCRKHQQKDSDIAQLLRITILDDPVMEPIFEKKDAAALKDFRGLARSTNLVLFSPAIPSNSDIDPFETLGRALSTYHGRVRHVPFLPMRGITDAHSTYCTTAGSVVIIVCQLVEKRAQVTPEGLAGQQAFARDMKRLADKSQVPNLLVEIGEGGCDEDFELVVRCNNYTDSTQKKMAQLIFQG